MTTQRARRVAKQVLQETSAIIERELGDPRLTEVTLTGARMTADLRNITISYSCLGGPGNRSTAAAALSGSSRRLRRQVAQALGLRFAPFIKFEFDDSLERADRIDRLLAKAGKD